jgi:hypothetical protein
LTPSPPRDTMRIMRSKRMRAAIRAAMREAPGSTRHLAREAGVSESALRQARDGAIRLTPATIRKIIRALRRWSRISAKLADRLEAALETERGRLR